MKVLEIKNNLVKISYNREDNLLLSGFVIIEDDQSPYVAQVLSLKADNGINYAIVKLLFTFDAEGIVKNYDGTIPSLDSDVTMLTSDELLDILPVNNPIDIGFLANQDVDLKVDKSILENNLLICSENKENTNTTIENFVYQLSTENNKSVIFDIDGKFEGQKLKFGEDFKLPLNYNTINFIYEHDLDNVDATSKALIQDIFLEVQEYSKTVLDKFIPFDTFINVVDQQYKELGLTELVLLKNKLLKYKEENVFAQNAKDIHTLRSAIRANLTNILDISSASDILQNEIMKYVYDSIDEMDLFVYSFVQLTNDNADKRLIRHFLTKNKIYTTIACSHNFKYLYELKERANNLILFAPQTLQHDFASYNTFLNKLNADEFIIYGKATQHVPLIIELSSILNQPEEQQEQDSSQAESTKEPEEEKLAEPEKPDDFSEESNSYSYETLINDDAPAEESKNNDDIQAETEKEQDIQEERNESYTEEEKTVETPLESEAVQEEEVKTDLITNIIDEELAAEEGAAKEVPAKIETPEIVEEVQYNGVDVIPHIQRQEDLLEEAPIVITEEAPPEIAESFSEENIIEESEEAPAPEIDYNENSLPLMSDEDLEKSIEQKEVEEKNSPVQNITDARDYAAEADDIMFSSASTEEAPAEESNTPEDEEYINEDSGTAEGTHLATDEGEDIEAEDEALTEEDLNFIEDVNIGNVQEELNVPVYPAETPIRENAQVFEQGDRVTHPKYGEGVVEKMIKYGNKTLCSINFANIGRRLLDPAISELEKVE